MRPTLAATGMALLAWAPAAIAGPGTERGWEYGHMNWGGGHGLFGGLMMVAFWGAIIALIVLAVRWFSKSDQAGRDGRGGSDAIEILKTRFANGELDEEEYKRRKSVLEN